MSSKVLMGLIVLMFVLQTIHIACDWYMMWLGFIYYSEMPDQALNALQVNGTTSFLLRLLGSMFSLLTTLQLAIADSIMVSTCSSPLTSTNNHHCEGLEVLDHMEQQLENSNCPFDVQHWVYRYGMIVKHKYADKHFQLLGSQCLVSMLPCRSQIAFPILLNSAHSLYPLLQLYYQL
jgi:hypothetical protein